MAAESLTHFRQYFRGVVVFALAGEPHHQGQRHHRRGDALLFCFLCRPAPIARIGDEGFDGFQRLILRQEIGRQIQQPGTHHAAMPPQLSDFTDVEIEARLVLPQREAFVEGLHHAVLDAVVYHLDEMTGPDRPGMQPALRRGGCERLHVGLAPRGGCMAATISWRETLVRCPVSAAMASLTSWLRLVTAILIPLRASRRAMLPPMRPSPTIPNSIPGSFFVVDGLHGASIVP